MDTNGGVNHEWTRMPPPVGSTFICQVVNGESRSGGRVLGAGGNSDLAGGRTLRRGIPTPASFSGFLQLEGGGRRGYSTRLP